MEKILPLLSGTLRKLLDDLYIEHPDCNIIKDLISADNLSNDLIDNSDNKEKISSLNKLINNEARMLAFRYNTFEISYLPKGKKCVYTNSEVWSRENRQKAKPARIFQKLLVKKYTNREFENFSNWLKAQMLNCEFSIVSGEDITKWYCYTNYFNEDGSLGNSCMRYDECSEYFEIYENHAKMLITTKDNLLTGRAIIWEINGKTYLDRIYTVWEYLENQFIEYARQHGWCYREDNSLLSDGEYQRWFTPDNNYKTAKEINLTIKLNRVYECMPYMDSFRYYNNKDNSINTKPFHGKIDLSYTDGDYLDRTITCTCSICGYEETVDEVDCLDELVYSSYENDYLCPNCRTYCDGLDDYVDINRTIVPVIWVESYANHHVSKKYYNYPLDFIENNCDYCKINDEWYNIPSCTKDNIIYCNDDNQYELIN